MGYIKKLKSNELVGGTDKATIYPVTSTKAVFEEVTEGNESSFKTQETINGEHDDRIKGLEDEMPNTVKSVTINGGTKTYTVDDAGNVNLDVYTTESAEGQATLAEEVGDIRSIVGTKDSPASDTLVNRVGELETLVGGSGEGSVNTRIANAKAEILGDAAEDYNTLGKVEDKIQEEVTRATAAEDLLQSQYTALYNSLSGTDIIIGTKPSSGQQANKIYRVPKDNDGTTNSAYYTDYMWYNNSWVTMAVYKVDDLASLTGYYVGTISSNTITVNSTNNPNTPIAGYDLVNGGSFKIKVSSAATNTSGNWTLSMNGLAAKRLFYNGESVTASNTWDADEVLSIYYDPTWSSNTGAYYASNAQGGGGKAEKIKYDNSQSGLDATDVQGTLDKSLEASVIREQLLTTSNNTKINFHVVPSTSKWAASGDGQHSNIFIIPEGVYKIKLTPTSATMMWSLLSRYEPAAAGETVYVASGLDVRYSSAVETEVTNLSDAKFICVRADDTVANAMCPVITYYYDDKTDFINNQTDKNTETISDVSKFVFKDGTSISSSNLYAGYIQDNGKWYKATSANTIQGAHYEYPVAEGELYRIDAGALDSVIYWLTESVGNAVDNTDAPITGSKITVKANTSIVVKVPAGAAYMAVMYSYYTAIIMPTSVVRLSNSGEDLSNIIPSYIVENAKSINLQSYTSVDGMLKSNGTWGKNPGKHIAIPVVEGDKYVISGDGNSFWGWLTNSYSVPVTANSDVPYVSGYFRVYQKDAVAVTVPSGAAYLILCTVSGGGISSKWNLYKVSSYKKRNPNELVKFRMASWNIGQFVYVDWNGGSTHVVPADQADAVALRFKKLINSTNADVIGICEYNPSYSASDLNPRNVIFQCYKNAHIGHKQGANCNSLFSNIFTFGAPEETEFAVENERRYYLHTTARLFDENIHIVEAHLDHTTQADRAAQIEELISKMSGYRYVIIAGDFNTGNSETIESEIAAFTDAGFTAANGGYLGIFSTSHVGHSVDHIMVKGFTMSDIQVSQESDSLSDHMLIYCDLTMLNV